MKVAALYKELRDKYAFSATQKPPKKKNKKYLQPEMIEVRLHKLFARHIPLKE